MSSTNWIMLSVAYDERKHMNFITFVHIQIWRTLQIFLLSSSLTVYDFNNKHCTSHSGAFLLPLSAGN